MRSINPIYEHLPSLNSARFLFQTTPIPKIPVDLNLMLQFLVLIEGRLISSVLQKAKMSKRVRLAKSTRINID